VKTPKPSVFCGVSSVEPDGIEPSTSALPVRRSRQDSSRKAVAVERGVFMHHICVKHKAYEKFKTRMAGWDRRAALLRNPPPKKARKPRSAPLTPKARVPPEARFWSKVEKTDGCWLWQAGRNAQGYGKASSAAVTT
jgi:hypothetical protein